MLERLYTWYMTDEKKPLQDEFKAYKVLLFADDESRRRLDVTDRFVSGDVHDGHDGHVEVRYIQRGAKYRVIFPPDRPVTLPVYSDEELRDAKARAVARGVLSALVGPEDDPDGAKGRCIDVTDHVKKYCGPKGNWYRDRGFDPPLVRHMFMADDPQTVRTVYPYLHVRTLRGVTSHPIY